MQIGSIPGGGDLPFRMNALPQHAFAHAGWARAERQASGLIERRERFLLLGRPGTGKTLLLHSLGRMLEKSGVTVRFPRRGDPLDGFAEGDVLLIDEAVQLSAAEAGSLLRSPNMIVLAGLPSLPDRASFRLDGFGCVTLEPLAPEEVARYVVGRLEATGRSRKMFTPEALAMLARLSEGLFRLVAILAGAGMFFAEQRGTDRVTVDDVAEAASMREMPLAEEEPEPSDKGASSQDVTDEAPEPLLAWVAPVAVSGRHWTRAGGLSAFTCASLIIIGLASFAAWEIGAVPTFAGAAVQGGTAPKLAASSAPDMALAPSARPLPRVAVRVASAVPPTQTVASSPPSPAVTPPPDEELSASNRPQPDGAITAPPAPPAASDPDGSAIVVAFTGPIVNDTMGQDGQLSLQLRFRGVQGPVAAVFHASQGLIGSGTLKGDIGTGGRITMSGRLMMGRNPFYCTLEATLKGPQLVGAATFVRATSGAAAHSSFVLSRL